MAYRGTLSYVKGVCIFYNADRPHKTLARKSYLNDGSLPIMYGLLI